jgi:hypothetical protein
MSVGLTGLGRPVVCLFSDRGFWIGLLLALALTDLPLKVGSTRKNDKNTQSRTWNHWLFSLIYLNVTIHPI